MPMRDGTGPFGLGFKAGRRRGICSSRFYNINASRMFSNRRCGGVLSIALALVIAVVRDLLNPTGVIRQIRNASIGKKVFDTQKNVVEAEYTVVDHNSVSMMPEKDHRKG